MLLFSFVNNFLHTVTENEIQLGILNNDDTASNAIYFERKIKNVDVDGNPKIQCKFFDMDHNGNVDKEAEQLLEELKNVKIRRKLPAENIFEFEVSINWCRHCGEILRPLS